MDNSNPLINLTSVSFAYPGDKRILDNLGLELNKGNRIGLIGPNGSGKTTLFHIIMGLLKPTSGNIELFGKPVKNEKDFVNARRRIGLLFQDADDQLFSPTVLEDIAFGPLNLGKSKKEAVAVAKTTLQFLGLTGFENRITYKLSGGEKRLVSLATILSMEPEVLLLDEPTNGLDDQTKDKIKDILNNLRISYMLISHEIDFLSKVTDKIYRMENGRILTDEEMIIHEHVHAHPHGLASHDHK